MFEPWAIICELMLKALQWYNIERFTFTVTITQNRVEQTHKQIGRILSYICFLKYPLTAQLGGLLTKWGLHE